ncbi:MULTISPECIES: glutathione S-transferase [Pseudomonas syringae group]|uniref:Glutathione S-transferase n=2 Tax=Pseudomonas coronafaciens TaxID=53409 RepID=A0AAE6UM87_9PSED|nr:MULTISPECIES: glutathione S-transferase [Pseudomonas syringae group]MCF5714868.1 glutathione S-transferase [Pseudomonas tremae]MCF5746163.1 glutathione S-transferase [Pseudomonas tremae]MCQ3016733.1 glutathione S-transferase [Pseudomonas tremae]QGL57768.1 glutathione S-transferase [Pseudomonas coronafaciens pv. oryzae str. 1_6]QGT82754.1 glutathione S-transferase [Pseudomonas coronafaciens pv. coronafaciens]
MTPVLYSFRRCPYAMRARMALHYADCVVDVHEVSLKAKPAEMLERSPKGTVPVLVLEDWVIEQSLDIMRWALAQQDPDDWLLANDPQGPTQIAALITENDEVFKLHLDRYKYSVRYPEHSPQHYREQGEVFLQILEHRLQSQRFLVSEHLTLADVAIAPFIRQFCFVDPEWFEQSLYPALRAWLQRLLRSELFAVVMSIKV